MYRCQNYRYSIWAVATPVQLSQNTIDEEIVEASFPKCLPTQTPYFILILKLKAIKVGNNWLRFVEGRNKAVPSCPKTKQDVMLYFILAGVPVTQVKQNIPWKTRGGISTKS